jgi:hypothetical protein
LPKLKEAVIFTNSDFSFKMEAAAFEIIFKELRYAKRLRACLIGWKERPS